jgi:nitroreductase
MWSFTGTSIGVSSRLFNWPNNIIMKALDALHSRNSAARLTGEVSPDALNAIVEAGLRAPDHGQLRPWRIIVVEGEARNRLGDLFVEAKRASVPDHPEELLEKLRGKPLRAPLILIVASRTTVHPKVPEIEQLLSAGAVAQNMLIAAHALGLGAMWRTGEMAYHPHVHRGLGFEGEEKIIGFLYMGEVDGRVKNVPTHNIEEFVSRW